MTSVSVTSTGRRRTLVEGDLPLTEEDFERIAALLYQDSGITLQKGKAALVYSRLAKRLRQIGVDSFRDYCELLASERGLGERKAMLVALTTNVTRFFREPHHFDHLRERLGTQAAKVSAGARLRIWSAGCSTGEEPYSIALTLLSVLPEAERLDVKILASDIDSNVVATARAGVYSDSQIETIPAQLRARWMERMDEGRWRMTDAVKNLISFKELNLMGHWPMRQGFDAIFCRNVAIYFDEPTQEKLWSRFGDKLEKGGRLYIGHSERVGLSRFTSDGLTVYRLAGEPS